MELFLLVSMARAYRGGVRSWTRAEVIPIEGTDSNDLEAAPLEAAPSDEGGLLALATKGGKTAELFRDFCRRNLTMESWYFIIAVLHYETTVSYLETSAQASPPWKFHRHRVARFALSRCCGSDARSTFERGLRDLAPLYGRRFRQPSGVIGERWCRTTAVLDRRDIFSIFPPTKQHFDVSACSVSV